MDSRAFSAIMNLVGVLLLGIAYGISADATAGIETIALIALIVGGILFLISFVIVIIHKGIPLPKGMQLDERLMSVLAGVAVLLTAIIYKYATASFVFTLLDNTVWGLWIAAGVLGLLAGLQAVYTRIL